MTTLVPDTPLVNNIDPTLVSWPLASSEPELNSRARATEIVLFLLLKTLTGYLEKNWNKLLRNLKYYGTVLKWVESEKLIDLTLIDSLHMISEPLCFMFATWFVFWFTKRCRKRVNFQYQYLVCSCSNWEHKLLKSCFLMFKSCLYPRTPMESKVMKTSKEGVMLARPG